MYRDLEKFYKKNSRQIKFRKISSWAFFLVAVPILCLGSVIEGDWLIKFIVISTILSISAILIPMALYFLFAWRRIDKKSDKKTGWLDGEDCILVKKYLKENNLYTSQALRAIARHYLVKGHTCGKANDLLAILLAVATAMASCVNSDGSWSVASIMYVILAVFFFVVIYYTIRAYSSHFRFYTGDDDLYQNLEEIMTRLYLEATDKKKN